MANLLEHPHSSQCVCIGKILKSSNIFECFCIKKGGQFPVRPFYFSTQRSQFSERGLLAAARSRATRVTFKASAISDECEVMALVTGFAFIATNACLSDTVIEWVRF